jgi:hypothetical protein
MSGKDRGRETRNRDLRQGTEDRGRKARNKEVGQGTWDRRQGKET